MEAKAARRTKAYEGSYDAEANDDKPKDHNL
jgi:hypothetical protein